MPPEPAPPFATEIDEGMPEKPVTVNGFLTWRARSEPKIPTDAPGAKTFEPKQRTRPP